MSCITVITDSSCDFDLDFIKEKNVKLLPTTIDINGKTYKDKVNLSIEEFYEKIREKNVIPKTAHISPSQFEEAFIKELEEGNKVICICISSEISGTYNSAHIAKANLESDDIYILDSRSVSIGLGYQVYEAVKEIEKNKDVKEITEHIEDIIKKQCCFFMVDTLEMLKRGGRLSGTQAVIGSILNIKPLLTIDDGKLKVIGKARGMKAAMREMINFMKNNNIDLDYEVSVVDANNEALSSEIVNIIKAELPTVSILLGKVGAAVGTHSGEGAGGVFFQRR